MTRLRIILSALSFWRRSKPTEPDDNGWSEERHERDRMAGDTVTRLRGRGL